MAKTTSKTFQKWPAKTLALAVIFVFIAIVAVVVYELPRHNGPANSRVNQTKPATDWRLTKTANNHQIEGYTSSDSVAPGGILSFQISCHSGAFTASIYRMGWYGGAGASKVSVLSVHRCQKLATPSPDKSTGLVDANWPTNFRLSVPKNWVPGVYLAKLTASDGYQNYVPFTVRSAGPVAKYLFVHAINTDLAYNLWGGNSLYKGFTPALNINRAVKASLNRPFLMPNNGNDGSGNFLAWEYPMVKFLEKNNYRVDYATDIDIQKNPGLLLKYKTIIVTGHNEYWSKQMRDGYDAAVAHGVNLAVFGANTAFRPVRFEPDPNNGAADRVMVNYKSAALDPFTKTNPQYSTPAAWTEPPLNRPESELLGLSYEGETSDSATVSADLTVSDASSWIFSGTGFKNGDKIPGLVGYEYDGLNKNLPYPVDIDVVFHSTLNNYHNKADFADGAYYKAASGAQVFNAGTIEWSWGLDPTKSTYNPLLVRITKNILTRFGD